jgi:type IV pilus assembly protein PilM
MTSSPTTWRSHQSRAETLVPLRSITASRDINGGGNAFSEEIQKRLNVSYVEAEALKIGGKDNADGVVPQEVESVIQQVNETVAAEVQRTLDFYAATSADNQFAKIFLSGGSAKLGSLGKTLSQRIGAPVEILQPFRRLQVDERKFDADYIKNLAPQAAVSVGLAMRWVGDK